ncbi:MAG: T9SS type A sorting domain-containing protein [Flavobacteriales bacterium]|nr:T9SS type A sorting domain-containing protein [Flavobacteriales bacterium]
MTDYSYDYNYLYLNFDEPGVYEISVTMVCYGSTQPYELSTSIVVEESCFGICPDSILTTQLDWNYFDFFIEGIDEDQPVTWNFGDGTEIVDDENIQHEFESGTFLVTAIFMDADCPWDGPTVLSVEIEVVNGDCPSEFLIDTSVCDSVFVSIPGLNEFAFINWTLDGFEQFDTYVPWFEMQITAGEHDICAWSDSLQTEGCPEICGSFVVMECEPICPDSIELSILLYIGCFLSVIGLEEGTEVDLTADGDYIGTFTLPFQIPNIDDTEMELCVWSDSLETIGCPEICITINGVECWTSVGELVASDISLFPNPASTQIQILSESNEPIFILVFDATGRKILETTVSSPATLDVSTLPTGSYILRADMGQRASYHKLTILR